MSNSYLYEQDFYAWANEQAALLRAGRLSEADIAHIAEEIESMGKSEKRELVSRLTILLLHLLKWRFQPGRRGKSWEVSIRIQRDAVIDHLQDNPSLQAQLAEASARAYRNARLQAIAETGLAEEVFPVICSWSFDEMTNDQFWPENEG
jgi:hypothetical protein